MKTAAANALSAVAREPIPEDVRRLYTSENLEFGPAYIIPKPFDRRLFVEVSFAVAQAAVQSGAASDFDLSAYRRSLEQRNGLRPRFG